MSPGQVDPHTVELRQRDIGGTEPDDPSGAKGFYEQSWAVVIGIDGYQGHLHGLTFAVSDALGIAETLVSKLGFPAGNLFLVVDPPPAEPNRYSAWLDSTRPRLGRFEPRATKDVLEELLFTMLPERAGPDDRVLVYFAGHGVSRQAPGGERREATPYLVPVDGRRGQWHTYIDLNSLTRQGAYFRAKHVFYLLDACSSGLTGMRSADGPSSYEKDLLHRRARQCLTASTAEQPAADAGYAGHSIWLSSADETDSNFSDLPLSTLRELASECPNLTSAVFITQTRGPRQLAPGAPPGAVAAPALLGLGLVTVVVAPPRTRDFSDGGTPPPDVPALVEVLAEHAHRAFSAEQWLACAEHPADMTIRGDRTAALFCDRDARRLALQLLRGIEDAPLRRALELLTKLIDQRALAATAWLHRAVVRAELGFHGEALEDIDTALARRRSELARDASTQERQGVVQWPEAHYHRGRILLADGRYTEAETALEIAVGQDDGNARAHYHRARAIRRLVEANLAQRARASARRYVELGAPFGPDDDIQRFVTERDTEPHG